jgi:GNAT superfamily N-acetyltransferase
VGFPSHHRARKAKEAFAGWGKELLGPGTTRRWYNGRMLNIRNATSNDIPLILQFIRELAEYEKAPEQAVATSEDLLWHGFSANPKFRVLIAEWDGQPAGFALFFYHYSTWVGRPTLFLEDLFVRLRFRSQGIGKALLLHLAKVAVEEGCGRFEWQVLDWNTPAIEFYASLGAKSMKEWLTMRVSGDELVRLASQAKD